MLKTIEAGLTALLTTLSGVFQQWSVSLVLDFISVFEQDSFRFESFLTPIKNTLGRIFDKSEAADGSITPFQAVCTAACQATVGTGNIAGVSRCDHDWRTRSRFLDVDICPSWNVYQIF